MNCVGPFFANVLLKIVNFEASVIFSGQSFFIVIFTLKFQRILKYDVSWEMMGGLPFSHRGLFQDQAPLTLGLA